VEALGRNYQPMGGGSPQQGEQMWAVGQHRKVDQILAGVGQPAPVALNDADRQAIATDVVAQLGGKLDQILARLTAAGQALDG
jgi:hypothetical protein